MTIASILLVPSPEWRERLLPVEGLCGSRLPAAVHHAELWERHGLCDDCDALFHDESAPPHCDVCHDDWPCGVQDKLLKPARWCPWNGESWSRPDALVVAWRGTVVRAGRHHLNDVLDDAWGTGRRTFTDYDGKQWIAWLYAPKGSARMVVSPVKPPLLGPWADALWAWDRGIATPVLLDTEDREVNL